MISWLSASLVGVEGSDFVGQARVELPGAAGPQAGAEVGKGQMGSALVGSLQFVLFLTERLFGYTR